PVSFVRRTDWRQSITSRCSAGSRHATSRAGRRCLGRSSSNRPSPDEACGFAGRRVSDYLTSNTRYWAGTYDAPNVESFIFRFYGRILKFDYGIDGRNHERLLDFGCGQGAALQFFDQLGFDCYGVDIASNDVSAAQRRMPHIADHFTVVDPMPDE